MEKNNNKADQGLKVSQRVLGADMCSTEKEGTRSEMSHGVTMVGFFGINLHESIQRKASSEISSDTENI